MRDRKRELDWTTINDFGDSIDDWICTTTICSKYETQWSPSTDLRRYRFLEVGSTWKEGKPS